VSDFTMGRWHRTSLRGNGAHPAQPPMNDHDTHTEPFVPRTTNPLREQAYYPFIRDVLVKGGFKMLINTFALPN